VLETPPKVSRIDKNSAEHYSWGGICEGWHLAEADTLSVVEERIPPGGSENAIAINAPYNSSTC